jgi:hypothetical protein
MLRDETQFKGSMRELYFGEFSSPSPQATRRGGELSAGFLVTWRDSIGSLEHINKHGSHNFAPQFPEYVAPERGFLFFG